jgi:SCY1-like protein 2
MRKVGLKFFSVPFVSEYFRFKEYGGLGVGPPTTGASQNVPGVQQQQTRPAHAKEYNFLDMELKYGILQVS